MNLHTFKGQARRGANAILTPIAGMPLVRTLWPKARAWSRPVLAALRGVLGWFPATPPAMVAVPVLLWLIRSLGIQRNDRIVFAVGFTGLAVTALGMLVVLVTAVWLRVRPQGPAQGTWQASAGIPFRTGYRPATFGWNPLVRVELSWEKPAAADVRVVFDRDGRHEEVTAHERGAFGQVVRKYTVSDVLGLARATIRRRAAQSISIKPAGGPAPRLQLVQQTIGGEQQPHPDGKPEGDLIEMRRYVPGDPLKLVLWKVYARTGRMLVRMPERTLSPFQKTLAYLVAAEVDEPAAGICRTVIESGALGNNFLFGADGHDGSARTVGEAVDRVIGSASARVAGGSGLAEFLARGAAQGVNACILFVPARPGAWLDRVNQAMAGHCGTFRVVVGADGLPSGPPSPPRRSLVTLLCKPSKSRGDTTGDVDEVCRRLAALGADVVLVDCANGDSLGFQGAVNRALAG